MFLAVQARWSVSRLLSSAFVKRAADSMEIDGCQNFIYKNRQRARFGPWLQFPHPCSGIAHHISGRPWLLLMYSLSPYSSGVGAAVGVRCVHASSAADGPSR